jgi:hypothetical protein
MLPLPLLLLANTPASSVVTAGKFKVATPDVSLPYLFLQSAKKPSYYLAAKHIKSKPLALAIVNPVAALAAVPLVKKLIAPHASMQNPTVLFKAEGSADTTVVAVCNQKRRRWSNIHFPGIKKTLVMRLPLVYALYSLRLIFDWQY